MEKQFNALVEFNLLHTREINPEGYFDNAGRFYLDTPPAYYIRQPSRSHPYSQMVHGRTLEYVCFISGIDDEDSVKKLKKLKKLFDKAARNLTFSSFAKSTGTETIAIFKEILRFTNAKSRDYSKLTAGFSEIEIKSIRKLIRKKLKILSTSVRRAA